MAIKYYTINDEIIPIEKAVINVKDLGFLRGYSVFDFLRIYKGQPVFMEDHLMRFEKSANRLGLTCPYSKNQLVEKIIALVQANEMDFGSIKIILTGGYSLDGFSPAKPNFVMLANKLPTYPDSFYTNGVKLMAYQYTRETPYTKTTNYLVPISLHQEIQEAEAFDVLYHDGKFISESARSNFFIVNQDGIIITPDKDALKGITRKYVLAIARKHFKVEVRPVSIKETMQAKEAFLTSSTKPLIPVRQVDFWRINQGIIGETTKKMMQLFRQHVDEYIAALV